MSILKNQIKLHKFTAPSADNITAGAGIDNTDTAANSDTGTKEGGETLKLPNPWMLRAFMTYNEIQLNCSSLSEYYASSQAGDDAIDKEEYEDKFEIYITRIQDEYAKLCGFDSYTLEEELLFDCLIDDNIDGTFFNQIMHSRKLGLVEIQSIEKHTICIMRSYIRAYPILEKFLLCPERMESEAD